MMKAPAVYCSLLVLSVCLVQISCRSSRKLAPRGSHGTPMLRRLDQRGLQHYSTRNGSADPEVNKRVAQMARYIVHNSEWVSMSTLSSIPEVLGWPFNNIHSIVDGPKHNSTGYVYFYMTPRDYSAKDITVDNRTTITMSMAQDGYCTRHGLDTEDLDCGKVIMVGHAGPLDKNAPDYQFAFEALMERHPQMKKWPASHNFFVAKLIPTDVVLIYTSGDPKCAPIPVYFENEPKFISPGEMKSDGRRRVVKKKRGLSSN